MQEVPANSDEPLVWYASFGSNMDSSRFACYIQGGRPAGATRANEGCNDKRLPRAEAGVTLPYQLYFAGESPMWGGGVAFVGKHGAASATKAKAHLITIAQFEQVSAQESRREYASPIDMRILREQGWVDLGYGRYDRILYCGYYQGYPLVTCTSPYRQVPYTKPSHIYLKVVVSGLHDAHGLLAHEIVRYLADKPGIAHNYSIPELTMLVHATLPITPRKPML